MKAIYYRKPSRIPFTPEGYQKLIDDKNKLETSRPDAVIDLRKAREMGDLSENEYYRSARSKLSSIDANLRRLTRLLESAVVVKTQNNGFVDIGSSVTVNDGNKNYTYKIVGGFESDPSKNTISHRSPLGKALMGTKANQKVRIYVPKGVKEYTVIKVI